jgi:selenocysteine-specific elongation factor
MVKEEGSLYDLVLHELETSGTEPLTIQEIARRTGNTEANVETEVQQLLDDEKIIDTSGKGAYYFSAQAVQAMGLSISKTIAEHLQKYPLRQGYPKEDMRSRGFNQLNPKVFSGLLKYYEDHGVLQSQNNLITLPNYVAHPGDKEQKIIAEIKQKFQEMNLTRPVGMKSMF